MAVRTQSIAVSPPPMTTTFFFAALSLPLVEVGDGLAEADLVGGDEIVERLQHALGFVAGRLPVPCDL